MKNKHILPEYPSIQHFPWKPNSKGDKIASEQDIAVAFNEKTIYIQEKVDAANCGMAFIDGYPMIRNRTKILRKGQELKNPSTKQFASAWNWMHERKDRFLKLNECGPYSLFGEWTIQQHGMIYDALPEWFIAYDVYDYEQMKFVDSLIADSILNHCGFNKVLIDFYGEPPNVEIAGSFLEGFANLKSAYAFDARREGVVIKLSNGQWITNYFKMVRDGFNQGSLLTNEIKKNTLKTN